MNTEIDILDIDERIRKKILCEKDKIPEYKERLCNIESSLKRSTTQILSTSLEKSKNELEERIKDLESDKELNFYILETAEIIEQYKNILNVPIKMSFMDKKSSVSSAEKTKNDIIDKYVKIASKYIDIDYENRNLDYVVCKNCGNKKNFDIIDDSLYICSNCFAEQKVIKHSSVFNDINRVNLSSKYTYDRKIHFRDCIKQYQGKQNCTIPQKVFDSLKEELRKHYLMDEDGSFKRVTKFQIYTFLEELDYPNQYENIHLIHYILTGKKPDDIGYLEDILLSDFTILTDLYNKTMSKAVNRKNFINNQFVLYQLLLMHGHPCNKDDFYMLKSPERKCFHDEVCRVLFDELGWNFKSIF